MSLRLPPVRVTASGRPPASQIRWCLEPGRARSTGEGPTWSPFERAHVGAVDRAPVQVQLAEGAQLVQQQRVQGRPDAGRGPVAQPPPAGHPGAADQRRGQLVPGDAGLEHEHDAGQCGPVTDRSTTRIAMPPRPWWWQQRLDPFPQSVRHELLDHPDQAGPDECRPPTATPRSFRNDLLRPRAWLAAGGRGPGHGGCAHRAVPAGRACGGR